MHSSSAHTCLGNIHSPLLCFSITTTSCDIFTMADVHQEENGVKGANEQQEDVAEEVENLEINVEEAEMMKLEGNEAYGQKEYGSAIDFYTSALALVHKDSKNASVYHANCGACYLALGAFTEAVQHCTDALRIDESYIKALMRRSSAYEGLDDLEKALDDAKKAQELGDNPVAKKAILRLEPRVAEKREKMKDEMLGKLKDMGNAVLGKFGMSLDNFKAEQNPDTGSYNISFKQ